ncbi:acyl-CoA dehydrogenase family protein [Erythrobacter sp. R86502]|uniref:acyl-CoA dehydrogenase family protein n=1 Tax=Erythrobacter sp. R86502 TaxID=3093846 RepID=UPI0036D291DF
MSLSSRDSLETAIGARAAGADHARGDLAADIDDLRTQGWLAACLPRDAGGSGWGTDADGTQNALDALRTIGRANLSVARLFEGHMNAAKLVTLYADEQLRHETFSAVRGGALLGVWGADDPSEPLTLDAASNRLRGAKRFTSGLGLVNHAIVSVAGEDGPQLLVVATDDDQRSDASVWQMGGMRATRSGRYDFDGFVVEPHQKLGRPGDYLREPFFEGGIWRYCAAHLGAAEALYRAMRTELVARGRAGDPHQQRRLVDAAISTETARLWVTRAARAVEADRAQPETAALSLLARDVTERSCRIVMENVEQALGMGAHIAGSPVERIGRDLSLFLCQAAPDAKRARAAQTLITIDCELEFL